MRNVGAFFCTFDIMLNRTSIYQFCERVKMLNEVDMWMKSFDKETIKQIIDWIKIDQLENEGVNDLGQVIGLYSYATEKISNGRKKAGDPYNLHDTGYFLQTLTVHVFKDYFITDADGQKQNENLFEKYNKNGADIIGLTDKNLSKLILILKDNFLQYARKILLVG